MIYFVSSINTEVGKSYVVGHLANEIKKKESVITYKPVQTGNVDKNVSDDIIIHRKIMNTSLLKEDKENITNPYLFKNPLSPHLAEKLENKQICIDKIKYNLNLLKNKYDNVIIEGAGGFFSPIKQNFLWADFIKNIKEKNIILVIKNILGSISESISLLEALSKNSFIVNRIYFNNFFEIDSKITKENYNYISNYAKGLFNKIDIKTIKKIEC